MSETTLTAAAAAATLKQRIESRQARVGIVGLGYVGLPLAVEFAKAGFRVTGIDVSEEKTRRVNAGESYVGDISTATLSELVKAGKIAATTDFSVIAELDTINICVPTPLRKTKDPDMSYIVSACQEIVKYFRPGTLVILESTTCCPCWPSPVWKWGATSFSASPRSAWTRAIPSIRPITFPKWWAAAPPPAPKSGSCSIPRPFNTSCRSVPRRSPRW
jgi:hypothetical protein